MNDDRIAISLLSAIQPKLSSFTFEDAKQMYILPTSLNGGYHVYAVQKGDITVLARVNTETSKISVQLNRWK